MLALALTIPTPRNTKPPIVCSAVCELLCRQTLHLAELYRHDTRLAVGEDKRGIVTVGRYEYNVFRGHAHQINARRYDQIFLHNLKYNVDPPFLLWIPFKNC